MWGRLPTCGRLLTGLVVWVNNARRIGNPPQAGSLPPRDWYRSYLAKFSRRPVANNMSFFLRPGSGLVKYRSLAVNCQENHLRIAVATVISKFMR